MLVIGSVSLVCFSIIRVKWFAQLVICDVMRVIHTYNILANIMGHQVRDLQKQQGPRWALYIYVHGEIYRD